MAAGADIPNVEVVVSVTHFMLNSPVGVGGLENKAGNLSIFFFFFFFAFEFLYFHFTRIDDFAYV